MKKGFFAILFIVSLSLFGANYNGQIQQFKQPDGTFVDVKLYGSEYYMRAEGLDDYTLIRDNNTQWICYAKLSDNGTQFISTGIRYKGIKNDLSTLQYSINLKKHLYISTKSRDEIILKNKKSLGINPFLENFGKTDPYPVLGNIKGLCIVVDFSDEPGTVPIEEFNSFCNDLNYSNYGNNGSIRKYYSDISGGLVDYENVVYGYFRAPLTFAAYDQMPFAEGARQILGLALNWVASQGFDFSTLSTNPDGSIEAINLMYTGNPPQWSQGMWFHQGYYTDFSANGVHSGAYNCSPASSPLGIGIVAHENGHMIGKWPDTYKYNNNTGPDGIGAFDLMCSYGSASNPVPPNPHFRSNAGWGKVVDISWFNGEIPDTANSLTCYKYLNSNDTNEFFLIENRMQTGRSEYIEDQGITIWHIDRNGNNQTTHHEVYLEHANNNIQNHSGACFHSGTHNNFGSTTVPNSNFYNTNPSGLRVWNIGPVGNIITYKLGAGQDAPTLNLTYNGISGDDNANGFPEPGESAEINIIAANFGQLDSGDATITCTVQGENANLLTITNPSQGAGVLAIMQTLPMAFHIIIAPEAELGTEIELKFLISDGTYSTYIIKSLIIGEQILIGNPTASTCSALFYDHGGRNSAYSNLTDFTTSFLAPDTSKSIKVEFLSFDLEAEPNCGYDYLKIYNGESTSAELLGTWCGTDNPGIITSTDLSGALTFEFHADEGVTGAGWEAIISCMGSSGIQNISKNHNLEIYPNPMQNRTYLTINNINSIKSDFKIVDVFGKILLQINNKNQSKIEIDGNDLKSGIYFVQLWYQGKLVAIKKLIVL